MAITGYVSQFDIARPPLFIRKNQVPLRRWLVNIVLFFSINVLNNHAFSYDISVPVHIILRSGGSVTTIIAGYLSGKKYSRVQVVSVILLTSGVVTAAWFDSQSKVRYYKPPPRFLSANTLSAEPFCDIAQPYATGFQYRIHNIAGCPSPVSHHGLIY